MNEVQITADISDVRKLVERLEYDASWDKASPLYYQLKKLLNENEESSSKFEIYSKTRTRFGHTYPGTASGMFAEVDGDTIHLTGTYSNKPVDIKFKVGDTAEYDSYNLHYLGTITKITEKRITIQPRFGGRTKSMDLYSFAWRNHDFDLERITAQNHETSMYI